MNLVREKTIIPYNFGHTESPFLRKCGVFSTLKFEFKKSCQLLHLFGKISTFIQDFKIGNLKIYAFEGIDF